MDKDGDVLQFIVLELSHDDHRDDRIGGAPILSKVTWATGILS